jgi:hypothetical protein
MISSILLFIFIEAIIIFCGIIVAEMVIRKEAEVFLKQLNESNKLLQTGFSLSGTIKEN